MPCTYTGGGSLHSMDADTIHFQRVELNTLTDLLCSACQAAEAQGTVDQLPKKVRTWWKHHKKQDAERDKAKTATGKVKA